MKTGSRPTQLLYCMREDLLKKKTGIRVTENINNICQPPLQSYNIVLWHKKWTQVFLCQCQLRVCYQSSNFEEY